MTRIAPACALLAALSTACSPVTNLHEKKVKTDHTGQNVVKVKIDSSPTPAWIYIEDRFIGTTPLRYPVRFDGGRRSLEVVAEPLPDNTAQVRQRRRFSLPPLPVRVHFFMNNPSRLSSHD